MIYIIQSLFLFLLIFLVIKVLINLKSKKLKIKEISNKNDHKNFFSLKKELDYVKKNNLFSNRIKLLSERHLFYISFFVFFITFLFFKKCIGINSSSFLLSIPALFFLKIALNIRILIDKEKTLRTLPIYIINLKKNVEQSNNILLAIKRTKCEGSLAIHLERFKSIIAKGFNIMEAFDLLKLDVDIKIFTELIASIKICYLNGGNFSKILNSFIENISKENINKEKAKEEAYSSIIVLVLMLIINIYLLFGFIFQDLEYAKIIKETFLGNLIINLNIISYFLISFFVYKIYKIGD